MCGIAGLHRRTERPVPKLNRLATELQLAIENRGRHAAGYLAVFDNGKVQMEKRPVPATRFVRERKPIRRDARSVLLHTRYATVGAKGDPRNAHPVISATGRCAAIHNGTIWNHDELFDAFGLDRKATVDSEIIPALIDYAGWEQAEQALSLMRGGAATAIIDVRRPQEVILARLRDYPLVVYVSDDVVVWASTEKAIRQAWWRTYGRRPAGRFIHVSDYTMLRVNGSVDFAKLAIPGPEPTRPTKPHRKRKRKLRPSQQAALTVLGARMRQPARRQLRLNTALPPHRPDEDYGTEPEPWQEDIVRQIMRIEGCDEAEARELVFG